jgi:agmatinase
MTTSYRSGTSEGPASIRRVSWVTESISTRTGLDFMDEVRGCDMGDVSLSGGIDVVLHRTGIIVQTVVEQGKKPVLLGREHTITRRL